MMTDEQRQHAVAAIQQALPALEWTLQPAKIKRLSRDFHWFSPLLTEQLSYASWSPPARSTSCR